MSPGTPHRNDDGEPRESYEHVAEPAVGGGGRELIAPRDHPFTERTKQLGRFKWVIVGLFSLAICSLAAAVVLSSSDSHATVASRSGAAWSDWSPPDPGLDGAQEIANYLAPYYRATPASQLAVVTVVNLNNPTAPVQVVVPAGSSGSVLPLPASSTIVYNLCGEGSSNCSIGAGTPSTSRLLLLRREALELALYTFKYIAGTQFVVALLPPGYTRSCTGTCTKKHGKPTVKPVNLAVAFERTELGPWLERPLRSTLPEQLPPTVSQMSRAREAELVSVLTSQGMYSESTASAQDDSTVITLTGPLQPQ